MGAGEPLAAVVTVWNVSNEKRYIEVPCSDPYIDWKVTVKDSKNKEVPLTAFGRQKLAQEMGMISDWGETLPPGREVVSQEILVNRLYDMTVADRYTITVRRSINIGPHGGTSIDLESEIIHVEVTDTPVTTRRDRGRTNDTVDGAAR